MESLLARFATEQDYGWFVAFLFWSLTAALWWKDGRALRAWRWVPWSAVSGGLMALAEIVSLAIPVQPLPGVPPYLLVERLLTVAAAAGLTGWIWTVVPIRTWLRVIATSVVVALVLHGWIAPRLTHEALAVLALIVGGCAWRDSSRWARLALAAAVLTYWLTSWGPMAEGMNLARRWSGLNVMSSLWCGAQVGAAWLALVGLWRESQAGENARQGEWRWFAGMGGAWLAAGLVLAAFAGHLARNNFETSALARAHLAAALLDRASIGRLLRPDFVVTETGHFQQPSGRVTPLALVPRLASPEGDAVRRILTEIARANPDANNVYLLVARGGHVLIIPSLRNRSRSDRVAIAETDLARFWPRWSQQESYYQAPAPALYGMLTHARAPVFAESGQLLGWLSIDFPPGQWAASQAQARSLVFVIVVLGLGVAGLFSVQKVRTREREHARAAALAAENADRLKTTFLAKVSHELRTPIQSILGYGDLLRSAIADPIARSRLEAQQQHGELMLRLVNDLLDLTALEAGAFRLRPRPTAVVELVRQTAESLASRAEAKGLAFEFSVEPRVSPWALVDPERVRQIVLNLVTNAFKFTDRGRVEVRLETGSMPDGLVLSVRDTGPGISAQEQTQLFKPFSRLEATAAKEGTGLGLALAAALCRGMGGDIAVRSTPGGGATFRAQIVAPACAAPSDPPISRSTDSRLKGMRIVVADDNTLVRKLFVAFLEEEGAICAQAPDGETALAEAKRESTDAVVLDLAMPRGDGRETTRRLRAQLGHRVRIVVVSAHAEERERESTIAAGADVFLAKPVELSALAAALVGPLGAAGPEPLRRPGLARRLDAQFREEVRDQRQAIVAAMADRDFAEIHARAHYLKNSAAVVNDAPLFEACGALEAAAERADEPALRIAWQRCECALEPWLRPGYSPFLGGSSPKNKTQHPSRN